MADVITRSSSGAIHECFSRWAARTPTAVALEAGQTRLSYRDLDLGANRLASYLWTRGVHAGSLVGMCLQRSPELVVAMLAILRCGAAYVPLDPDYPVARLDYMRLDSGAELVVTTEALADRLQLDDQQTILVDRARAAIQASVAAPPPVAVAPHDLAYAMYTSGSTGAPKAVLVEHRNVVNLCLTADYVSLSPRECLLHAASASFDATTFEVWGALLNGARLVIASPGVLTAGDLGQLLRQHQVTTAWLTAALFHRMVDEDVQALQPVMQLLAGGDVVSASHVRRALAARPGRVLVNGYGPTETTTFACCHVMTDAALVPSPVPLGKPIRNVRVHIVDEQGRAVPAGEAGELWIAGAGVSRGYLNRPELNAEKFVPEPEARVAGARAYRSGDLVRCGPDGTIEFLGRIDDQVKIRGYRIEPGEIEAALTSQPGIRQAVVVARTPPTGDKVLVAYVVVEADAALSTRQLRRSLVSRLPSYMIPASFVHVPTIPMTLNGKIDREALPDPDWSSRERFISTLSNAAGPGHASSGGPRPSR